MQHILGILVIFQHLVAAVTGPILAARAVTLAVSSMASSISH